MILQKLQKKKQRVLRRLGRGGPTGPTTHPINFVTGTLGAGKSYFATRTVFSYLQAGKIVACNYDLVGSWYATVAERTLVGKIGTYAEKADLWNDMRNRAYRFDTQDDLYNFTLPGSGEDRGLIVLDEAALRMNSREWQHRQKVEREKYGSGMRSLQWYINMRKLGWTILVLSHDQTQLDNQLQLMGGCIIRLRNLSKALLPLVKVPLADPDNPRFVAIHKWPEVDLTLKKEVYKLDMRIARHYRSMQTFDATPDHRGLRLQEKPEKLWRPVSGPLNTWDPVAHRRTRRGAGAGGEGSLGAAVR